MRIIIITILSAIFLTGCSVSHQSFDLSREKWQQAELLVSGKMADWQDLTNDFLSGEKIVISEKEDNFNREINLPIPFISQAPMGDWGMPYQEACEEASLIGAYKFLRGETLTAEVMDLEIKKIVEYQKENGLSYTDSSAEEIKFLAENYFSLRAEIFDNADIKAIENVLLSDRVVIAPFAGRMLGNKFYSNYGPIYHFLIIRGFDEKYFYTNDVGTRHGENFRYRKELLLDALHDLPLLDDGDIFRPYEDRFLAEEEKESLMKNGAKRFLALSLIK